MVCPKCGRENLGESSFCVDCGERIDGVKCCKVCRRPITEGAVFCECGNRVDGKKVCVCGQLQDAETKFCPKCGRPQGSSKSPQNVAKSEKVKKERIKAPKSDNESSLLESIFSYIAVSLAMAGLLTFFIAIFTPIFNYSTDMGGFFNYPINEGTMFYDFFYEVFSDYKASGTDTITGWVVISISALIVLANLVICTLMFIIGMVKGIKSLVSRSPANLTKYLLIALLSTVTMMAWFKSYSIYAYASTYGESLEISYHAGVGSVLACVIGAISLVSHLVFSIILDYKEFTSAVNITRFVLSVACIILVFIIIGIFSSSLYIAKEGNGEYYMRAGLGIIIMLLISAMTDKYAPGESSTKYPIVLTTVIIYVALIAIAILITYILLSRLLSSGGTPKREAGLPLLIQLPLLTIAFFVVSKIFLSYKFYSGLDIGARGVMGIVLSFIALGAKIAALILSRRTIDDPQPEPPQYYGGY